MTGFLIYDAKVAVLIVVFYMFYRLLLSKETFHRVNRVVLLSTALLSFVLPLCVITTHQTVVLDAVPVVSVGDLRPEVLEEDSSTPLWQMVIPILYIIGVLATLGHTLLSVWRVMMLVYVAASAIRKPMVLRSVWSKTMCHHSVSAPILL